MSTVIILLVSEGHSNGAPISLQVFETSGSLHNVRSVYLEKLDLYVGMNLELECSVQIFSRYDAS